MKKCSVVLERINVDKYLPLPSLQPEDHSSSPQTSSQQRKFKRKNPKVSSPVVRVLRNRNISVLPYAKNVYKKNTEIVQHNKKERTSDAASIDMPNVEIVSRQDKKTKASTSKSKKNGNEHEECPPSKSNLTEEQTTPVNQDVCIANNSATATINVQINVNLCATEVTKKTPEDLAASCFENLLCGIKDYLHQQKPASSGGNEEETTTADGNGTTYCLISLVEFWNPFFLSAFSRTA